VQLEAKDQHIAVLYCALGVLVVVRDIDETMIATD
jgi:hypothetical protein